jgi:hypothetical protein
LGESLQRLQLNLEEAPSTDMVAEDQFHEWRSRWSQRREQISQRLALLDRQLESLVRGQSARPQLSLVAAHHVDVPQSA